MKQHLQYNWWKYLLVLILPMVFWYSAFTLLLKPARNEQLRVLFVGDALDTTAVQEQLSQLLPSETSQMLQEITVAQALPGMTSYNDFLTAQSFYYDLIIFPESQMTKTIGQSYFSRIPPALLEQFPNTEIYVETVEDTELSYGFWLDDSSLFMSCYYGNDRCCLFFSPESVNLGSGNKQSDPNNDAAVKAAQLLLEVLP